MMTWLYYLLEANLYLAVFYGFYRLMLHRETFYQLSRCYLLGTSVLAFLLPLFQISYLDSLLHPIQNQAPVTIQYSGELLSVVDTAPEIKTADAVFICYLLVVAFLLYRFCISLYRIFKMAARGQKIRENGIIQIHFSQSDTAFSFFNLLFINPETEKHQIVLQHEMIHIKQKHSLDVLFFEILLICNWFNPLCWLMKQDIKLIHEYIADEASTNQGLVKHDYALFLIHNSFGPFPNTLTSQMFNQSILKNRISMLNKKRSAGRTRLRFLYVLPLTGGMLCASTLGFTKDYAFVDLYAKEKRSVSAVTFQEPTQKTKKLQDTTSPARARVKKLPVPPTPPKQDRSAKNIKFPPPVVVKDQAPGTPPTPPKVKKDYKPGEIKFPPPSIKSMSQYDKKTREELKLGPNPIYVNNGEIVQIPAGKKFRFEAQSVSIHPKNTDKLIELYGEQARDGVIELKEGKIILE